MNNYQKNLVDYYLNNPQQNHNRGNRDNNSRNIENNINYGDKYFSYDKNINNQNIQIQNLNQFYLQDHKNNWPNNCPNSNESSTTIKKVDNKNRNFSAKVVCHYSNKNDMKLSGKNEIKKNQSSENIKINNYFNNNQIKNEGIQLGAFLSDKKIEKSLNDLNLDFSKDILRIFIYIYYYEKILKKQNIFTANKNEKYYLISQSWLNIFKNYYCYNKFFQKINKKQYPYNYNNVDKNIDNIIEEFSKEQIFENKPFSDDLKNIKKINTSYDIQNGISFTNNGIIFPSKIMTIIKKFDKNIKTKVFPRRFFFKNNTIYYINNEKIIIGFYQYSAFFVPKIIFIYNNNESAVNELNNLKSISINNYLNKRKSNQILNEKGENIGAILIVTKDNLGNKDVNIQIATKNLINSENDNIINNNEIIKLQYEQKIKEMENKFKYKENEFSNNLINLNTINKKLEEDLKQKDEIIKNIKEQLENLKKENLYLKNDNINKKKEIDYIKNLKNNQNNE